MVDHPRDGEPFVSGNVCEDLAHEVYDGCICKCEL
jgi:hypothetical protein